MVLSALRFRVLFRVVAWGAGGGLLKTLNS